MEGNANGNSNSNQNFIQNIAGGPGAGPQGGSNLNSNLSGSGPPNNITSQIGASNFQNQLPNATNSNSGNT